MSTKSHIYGMETAANELIERSESILNTAFKDSIELSYIANLSEEQLKMIRDMKAIDDTCKKLVEEIIAYIKSEDERQTKIEDTLKEINRKLDRINNK